jgi:glycosyltransferase involved in cell wall biosynthesis
MWSCRPCAAGDDAAMKVLQVAAYYAPAFVYGGPPRSIHALCRALTRAGVDLQVFTTDANGAHALPPAVTGSRTFEQVPVRYFPRTFPRSPIGSRFLNRALRQEVGGYDVVHIHGLWNRVVWSAAREASRAGVPYVLSPRGMLEPAARAHRAWRKRAGWALIESRLVSGARLLHATSQIEYDTLRELRTGVPVIFIPNGVEIEPQQRDVPAAPLVVFVGRLHPIKRLDLLIDAFAAVRQARPDAKMAIAGPDEAGCRDALVARAGHHADAVTWVGAIDEAQRRNLLGRASALVMCSDSESFGMSVLEAMAAAVPVVVTRTCPWSDVERHEAGYWVEQNPAAIGDALVRILNDPDRARAMGKRGRALAERTYRWDAIARAFTEQYCDVRALSSSGVALPALS